MRYLKLIFAAIATSLIVCTGSLNAASTVVSEGVATITSKINLAEYKKRAIENALQNIALEREQALTSFTIIENGQMLLDQVRSISQLGILSYKILKESTKDGKYYVKIEAVVKDGTFDDSDEVLPDFCRKTNLPAVDLNLTLVIDLQQFPAWMDLNTDWVKNEIIKANFRPRLTFISNSTSNLKENDLYRLFEKNTANLRSENLYRINLKLNFKKTQNESFFIKDKKLNLALNSVVTRNGQSIGSSSKNLEFTFMRKFGVGIPVQSNKKVWQNEKIQIVNVLIEELQQRLNQLECISINARLKKNSNSYFIDYGKIDGLKVKDIFILETAETQKFYFKIDKLGDRRTQLKLISEVGKIDLNGKDHFVRIVEAL
jgi:hypothetical protein